MWSKLLDGREALWNAHTGGPMPFEYVEGIPCRCHGSDAALCFRYCCERCGAAGHRFTLFPNSEAAHERCDTCFDMEGPAIEALDSWQEMAADAEQVRRAGDGAEPEDL